MAYGRGHHDVLPWLQFRETEGNDPSQVRTTTSAMSWTFERAKFLKVRSGNSRIGTRFVNCGALKYGAAISEMR
jgi:hypothetical protein